MALRRQKNTDPSMLAKSVEDMRRELQDTLARLDESIAESRTAVEENKTEVLEWSSRAGEAEACMGMTDDLDAQEGFQMLQVQALGYMRQHETTLEAEEELLTKRMAQAEELRRAVNRLEVDNIKAALRQEIASTEITAYNASPANKTASGESEREVQRLILNAEALLEIKG